MNEEKYQKALEAFFVYPGWREEYESAPSPLSRRYKGLEYYYSEYDEKMDEDEKMYAEYEAERKELEEKMGLEDWRYLYNHCGSNPFKTKCRKRIEELETAQKDEAAEGGEGGENGD